MTSVRGTGLDLDTARGGAAVRLASSRGKPADNRSGIGINERHGIAVRRKVSNKIQS